MALSIFLVSIATFCLGATGLMVRRNILASIMCIELMFNSVGVLFVLFSKIHGTLDGQVAVLFMMVVAAAEAAIGLALVVAFFRTHASLDTMKANKLRN
jgi:NADH-quinone oxidoreductase subunit K